MAKQTLSAARAAARARILAGYGDREAAARYRRLADSGNFSAETSAEFRERAIECERISAAKLRSSMG